MSLPSRVRSPTPANTERPLCWYAMLRISSCTMTVLPVPAPPNSPIFEPLAKVHMRSMTLIPVSRISTLACCSDTGGAGRWIGHRVIPSGAGSSSIGAPITLNMRPSVSTPTGTEIGPPVARAGSPRRKPSVASIAMVRTTLSPMAPSTSSTTVRPSPVLTSSASNSSGCSPGGNSTSTTAPMTWLTRPSLVFFFSGVDACFVLAICLPPSARRPHCFGAGNDLHQLRGDARLADLFCEQRERVDQIAGCIGCVLHRDHLGRVLAGLVLEHCREHLRLDVSRQQAVEHRLWVGFVDVVGARAVALTSLAGRNLRRDQHADLRLLLHGRDPLRVAEHHRIGVAPRVLLEGDGDRRENLDHSRPVRYPAHLGDHLTAVAEQEVAPLAADRDVPLAFGVVLIHVSRGGADVVHVDGPAKTLVRRDQDHHRALSLTAHEERVLVLGGALGGGLEHLEHLLGVRTRRLDRGLRALQASGRDDLHGLGDLLRVADRVDPPDDVPECRHLVGLRLSGLFGFRFVANGRSDLVELRRPVVL